MVQRKAPTKIGSQPLSTKPESFFNVSSSHHQQESSHKRGGEAKMKLKKARCINMAGLELEHVQLNQSASHRRRLCSTAAPQSMPNYMKPTSSSDARKERRQVTHHPTTSERSKKKLNSLIYSSTCPSSRAVSGPKPKPKPVRVLKRKVSLKKSLGIPPCPKPKVNRATCSSTLRDSKFPKVLELSPGGTEAEGTSAVKVCPFKYCSLNGHVHDALPPLKCFLASRRKLLKTHKCMKQKGVSPFRKQSSGKDLDTGQAAVRTRSGLEISSLIEEIGSDFFVEIYAKPQEPFTGPVKCDEGSIQESLENLNKSVGAEDQMESSKCEEDGERNLVHQIHETYSDVSFEDDLDRSSDLSIDDLEVMMNFLEYVSCDQEDEADKEKIPSLTTDDYTERKIECWTGVGVRKDVEDLAEADKKIETFESIDINLEEDIDPFSDDKSNFSDDGLGPILGKLFDNEVVHDDQFFLETADTSVTGETAENDKEAYHEECSIALEPESLLDNGNSNSIHDNISESATLSEEKAEFAIIIPEGEVFEPVNPDSNPKLSDEISEKPVLIDSNEEETGNEKVEISSLSEVQIPAANQEVTLIDNDIKEDDQIQTQAEIESNDGDGDGNETSMFSSMEVPAVNKDDQIIKTAVTNQSPTDDVSDSNVRLSITKKRTNEESEKLKGFNPRAPNFLPEEPDPEAEKVDLRHQMMDERKNAEEWMLDYALQQAVTKLAPARRRKVALLVEAFETVIPLPVCDKPLRHATQSFSDPRPLQACN